MNSKDFQNLQEYVRNDLVGVYELLDANLEIMTILQLVTLLRDPQCVNTATRHKLYGEGLARLLDNNNTPTRL